ncbi:MAG: PorP/SprF family type IX secretion system membrane protein [Haliscomenobacter sp.]
MKNLFFSMVFLCLVQGVFAQNEATVSHYQVAPILVNPAFAGFRGTRQVLFNARTQWSSFADAPKSVSVLYNGAVGNSFGFGVGVTTQSAARLNELKVRLNYAFRIKLEDAFKLSIGFSTEYQQMRIGNSILTQAIYDYDDILNGVVDGRQLFDASLGVCGLFNDNTFVGLSFVNLISARLNDIVTNSDQSSFLRHYTIYAGHRIRLSDGVATLEPSIMLRQAKDAPFQADVNLKLGFLNDRLITGLSYRSLKSIGFLFGSEIGNSLRAYYTYDMTLQDIQQFSTGTHEVTIGLGLNTSDKRKSPVKR